MFINAYAKINLSLDITSKRADGYHELDTVMQSIDLHDRVEVLKNKNNQINISCSDIKIPTDEHNIAYKAARLFLDHFDINDMGVDIHLLKGIPVEAGLGGGSADAAAVLKGLVELFKIECDEKEILDIALKLGADVPFCYVGGIKRCRGIGELMQDLPELPKCKFVLCKPPVGVSTKAAYDTSDKFPDHNYLGTDLLVEAIYKNNIVNISENISNRFDDVLIISEVSVAKAMMLDAGALAVSMSGSGSTAFGMFENDVNTVKIENELSAVGQVYVCEAISSGVSII